MKLLNVLTARRTVKVESIPSPATKSKALTTSLTSQRRAPNRVTTRSGCTTRTSVVRKCSIAVASILLRPHCHRVVGFILVAPSAHIPRASQVFMGQTPSSSSSTIGNPVSSLNPNESGKRPAQMRYDVDKPIVPPTITEKRVVPVASWPAFAITAAIIPVWATTVVPLSLFYQVGKAVVRKIARTTPRIPSYDSQHDVDLSSVVKRSDRKYDVVVLGVTGFCGKLAARYLAKTYGMDGRTIRWAVAGRSRSKLEKVLSDVASELGISQQQVAVDVIVADASDPTTLPDLVQNTRVVASTAGPFVLVGNHVVEYCAKYGTHYADITGEVDWVKSMHGLWHDTAMKTGAKIVSFCGHDSIPWDLNMLKIQQAVKDRNDNLKSVSFWDEIVGEAPGGTFATIMTFLDGHVRPPPVEHDPFARDQAGAVSTNTMSMRLPVLPAPANSPWDDNGSSRRWQVPFLMAMVNSQICRWSHALQSTAGSKQTCNVTYTESMLAPDFKSAFVGFVAPLILFSCAANPLTRPLVQYVIPQQGEGPDAVKMDTSHFLCVSGVGEGENGTRVETCMYFPKDAGCVETARMLMESALCLATQEDQLESSQGGFWTPATAMGDLLLDRLVKTGTSFQRRVVAAGK